MVSDRGSSALHCEACPNAREWCSEFRSRAGVWRQLGATVGARRCSSARACNQWEVVPVGSSARAFGQRWAEVPGRHTVASVERALTEQHHANTAPLISGCCSTSQVAECATVGASLGCATAFEARCVVSCCAGAG